MIRFTSHLPATHLLPLEDMLFFNRRQGKFKEAVYASVSKYGQPIIKKGERLELNMTLGDHFETPIGPQCLFALDKDRLVGALLYFRENENLVIMHIATIEGYPDLPLRFIVELKKIISKIKGVNGVRLEY